MKYQVKDSFYNGFSTIVSFTEVGNVSSSPCSCLSGFPLRTNKTVFPFQGFTTVQERPFSLNTETSHTIPFLNPAETRKAPHVLIFSKLASTALGHTVNNRILFPTLIQAISFSVLAAVQLFSIP